MQHSKNDAFMIKTALCAFKVDPPAGSTTFVAQSFCLHISIKMLFSLEP